MTQIPEHTIRRYIKLLISKVYPINNIQIFDDRLTQLINSTYQKIRLTQKISYQRFARFYELLISGYTKEFYGDYIDGTNWDQEIIDEIKIMLYDMAGRLNVPRIIYQDNKIICSDE